MQHGRVTVIGEEIGRPQIELFCPPLPTLTRGPEIFASWPLSLACIFLAAERRLERGGALPVGSASLPILAAMRNCPEGNFVAGRTRSRITESTQASTEVRVESSPIFKPAKN